jgi:predicted transcriptional regulator
LNGQVLVIDKQMLLSDIIHVFIENDTEQVMVWNRERTVIDGIITYTNLVKMLLTTLEKALLQSDSEATFSSLSKKKFS